MQCVTELFLINRGEEKEMRWPAAVGMYFGAPAYRFFFLTTKKAEGGRQGSERVTRRYIAKYCIQVGVVSDKLKRRKAAKRKSAVSGTLPPWLLPSVGPSSPLLPFALQDPSSECGKRTRLECTQRHRSVAGSAQCPPIRLRRRRARPRVLARRRWCLHGPCTVAPARSEAGAPPF